MPDKTGRRWEELATYNSEVARGLVHTDGWKARMAALQTQFDMEHGVACITCGRPIREHIEKFGHARWCAFEDGESLGVSRP